MARFDFDVSEYETPEEFGIMPVGDYKLKATEAEEKETSSGGTMISATFVVIEPAEFKNRKVWMNFNVVNKSEKAQNFGRRMIAGWARAAGKPNAKDTDQLLDKPFWARLGVEEGTGQYKDKNIISSFLLPEGVQTEAPKREDSPEPKSEPKPEPTPAKEKTPTPAATGEKRRAPWDD